MSQKINSKNLSYDTSLPPFLAAMRAQAGAIDGHKAPSIGQRQLGKKRSDSEEAEDAPLVLDEDGNVMSVDIENDGTVRQRDGDGGKAEDGEEDEVKKDGEGTEPSMKPSAAIGGRKRKVGKIIGDAAHDTTASEAPKADKEARESDPKEKKAKKKAKKVKLSFDEEDG